MDVRTFEAFTMRDAIKAVKQSLGSDAVILGTKEKAAPNGKGMMFEVSAAAVSSARVHQGGVQANLQQATLSHLENLLEGVSVRMTALADSVAIKRQVQTLEGGISELKLLILEALRGKDGSTLKDLPAHLEPVERLLRAMGVEDAYLAEMVQHLRSQPTLAGEAGASVEQARADAMRWMLKRVRIAPRWTFSGGGPAIQVAVGASGAGKSSVIAKLAAHFHLREKRKVAVFSLDNARLAAAEQMRITCKVIGVPFAAAGDVAELKAHVGQQASADLILIDTAGRSLRASGALGELEALREAMATADLHVCLPVTEKPIQHEQAIRAFAPLGLASMVFTRLDEGASFGEIFNLTRKWSLPLSYFSVGPQVPEDLERATRERVVERIFGL